MRYQGFIGGSSTAHSSAFDVQRTINWYVEGAASSGAKGGAYLLPTPGVTTFVSHGSQSPVRAMWSQNARCFAVIGTKLVEVLVGGTVTDRGTVAVDVGNSPATITSNGDGGGQLLIISGDHVYTLKLGDNTFTDVTTTGAMAWSATIGAMADGYFLALDTTDSTLYLSDLLSGTTYTDAVGVPHNGWNPLQFTQRSLAPDRWVSLAVVGREIWLLGEETSEVWYNAGTAPFPFAPHPSGVLPWGCAAKWSAAPLGDSLIWLAKTRDGQSQIVQSRGPSASPISTKPLEYALSHYTTLSDAVAMTYEELGHTFYVLTFPTDQATWAYDLTTGLWCERGTWISESALYQAWRPLYHAFAFGQHLVGDRAAGVIYTLASTAQTDVEGREIRRVRRAPVITDEAKRLFFSRLQIDLESGLGTVSGQGRNPQLALWFSNDGGKTWTAAGVRTAGSGPLGEYTKRVIWTRLGSARNRVFEVVCSDPAPWRVIDAYLDLRPTASV